MVYLDDVLVIGKNFTEHLNNLRVFDRFRIANLKLEPGKCSLAGSEVVYLGYVVSRAGISADQQKIKAVNNFPQLHDITSLRSFLGLASYYRRFIPNFSTVAGPLYALTQKNTEFLWNQAQFESFHQLKQLLIHAPVLAFPNFSQEFILETDASGSGLGAILAQQQEDGTIPPIAYASRTLQQHEKKYGATELEALGVVWSVKHFRHYLYGHKCIVYTDHEPLKSLLNTSHPSGKLARWGLTLQEVDLTIHYRPGRINKAADSLSRFPVMQPSEHVACLQGFPPVVGNNNSCAGEGNNQLKNDITDQLISQQQLGHLVETSHCIETSGGSLVAAAVPQLQDDTESGDDNIKYRQRKDEEIKVIVDFLENCVLPDDDNKARELLLSRSQYFLMDGVLYYVVADKTLRLVPPISDREQLFEEAHSGPFGAHLREAKVHGQLSKHYWWPKMRSDIHKLCNRCLVCATRRPGKAVHLPLNPIPVKGPFHRVGVDVIQFIKSYSGNKYAVVFTDYLTKWPEVLP